MGEMVRGQAQSAQIYERETPITTLPYHAISQKPFNRVGNCAGASIIANLLGVDLPASVSTRVRDSISTARAGNAAFFRGIKASGTPRPSTGYAILREPSLTLAEDARSVGHSATWTMRKKLLEPAWDYS